MSGRDYWDEVADLEDSLPRGWRRHARRVHLELVERWLGRPTGRWLKTDLFEERSPERALLPHLQAASWVGLDLSPQVARRARSQAGCTAVAADVRRLPYADATFDGVLSTSTLDHFAAADQIGVALAELRRVLRVGGSLLLTLDNARHPLIRARNRLSPGTAARSGLVPFEVGATLTEPQGRAALGDAGFAVRESTHLLHAPHVVGTRLARFGWWERRALPGFDRLGATQLAPFTGHYVAFIAVAR